MTPKHRVRLSRLSLGLIAALAAAPAFAQSTSAGLGGQVVGADGQPVIGAEVTIRHVESGTVSRATTDANGRYTARGLRVGGPYTVVINKAGEGTTTEDDVFLNLNQVNTINAALGGDITEFDRVVVTGVAGGSAVFSADNKGVGTSVDGRRLEITPQGNRSIDDIARLDPRISVLDQASGAISVAGVNNRYNTISVDGLAQGDPFGLSANGLPYTNSPISVDTIAAYDIKVSDYDVSQDAVGASINAVTKSGTNAFSGSVYYALKDASSMVASRDGRDYDAFDKDETRGVTFGGPILKDRLFFFGSYEEQEISNFGGASLADGFSNGIVSREEIDEVIDIARDVWGFDAGTYGEALGVHLENKRYLGKIDWNISDGHRASLTYQQTEEAQPSPYDDGPSTVILSTRWFQRDSTTKNTSFQLFSDWSDRFSTELKVAYMDYTVESGNAVDLPQINVTTANNPSRSGQGVRLGEDRNRHQNRIETERLNASLFGTYYAGDHTFKFGVDYLDNDAMNLYGRDLHGTYLFDSIDDFRSGTYESYTIRRPTDGFTEADTAASIGFTQISPFVQDTWQVNDNLSLMYGVRVNIPKADNAPPRNANFESVFGYPNDYQLGSSNRVVLPRVSFNYLFDTERYSQLRGGLGLFQSVPPYVWLANPYQNNGVTAATFTRNSYDPAYPFSPDPYNQNVPSSMTASGQAQVDTVDPDFKLPTVWKASLGYDHELPWAGLVATAEIQHLRNKDAVFYEAINIGRRDPQTGLYDAPTDRLFDGRGSYWCTIGGSMGNANKNCGNNAAYDYRSTRLSNTDQGRSTAFTLSLDKPISNGWYGNISYTHTRATEAGSENSSQAWSSYQFVSRLNPNEEIASTASREVRDQIKLSLGWERAFFGDYKTSVTGFYTGRSGLPYTWTINGDLNGDRIFQDPAYIPLVNDPNVLYVWGSSPNARAATAAEIAAFQSFIGSNPYLHARRGGVAERNAARMPWSNQFDISFRQELPGFFRGHKSVVRLDVYNFLNLLDSDWGVQDRLRFDSRYLANLNRITPDGRYVYDISANAPENIPVYDANALFPSRLVSRWSAMVTLNYQF